VELDVAVRLGEDIDGGLGAFLLSEEVLVVGEVVRLDWGVRIILSKHLTLGIRHLEELGGIFELGTKAGDLQRKVGVRLAVVVRLRAIDGGLNLDTNVKGLAGDEVDLVGREDTSEVGARGGAAEGLSRDNAGTEGRGE